MSNDLYIIVVNLKKEVLKMVVGKSPREILKEDEIKNKLKECFNKCAVGRTQLRKCVNKAMDSGLTKEDILSIANETPRGIGQEDAKLCSIIAVGQILNYEKKHTKKNIDLTTEEKKELQNSLRQCFNKCGLAKKQLRKCIVNALDAGLTVQEVLAITDDIVGGLGESQVSLCAIVAINQALIYEETIRKEPIDVISERKLERGDF